MSNITMNIYGDDTAAYALKLSVDMFHISACLYNAGHHKTCSASVPAYIMPESTRFNKT